MSIADPLSLTEAKRLATGADTVLLRATRDADLETPIGAYLRLDDGGPAYLLELVEGGERLGRYSFLGIGPRRLLEVRGQRASIQSRPLSVDRFQPDLPIETVDSTDPLATLRQFLPRRRVVPLEGMPRFTGGAVGALAYDAVSAFEPSVPQPTADPVGVPLASFIETDLVIVFDHLTHTISAIASLHTELPDLDGRYRIAERAIFEALDRTARPSAGEHGERQRRRRPDAAGGESEPDTTSLPGVQEAGDQPRSRPVHPRRRGRQGCDRGGRGDPGRPGSAPVFDLPPAGDGRPVDGIGLYRALRRVNPSPYLFFVRTPSFEVVGASPELLLQVEGDRLTTHPIAGTRPRGATRGRGRPAQRGAPARPEGEGRARHARRPRPKRPRPGGPARHGPGDQVHGGRALQPRPAPGQPRRGPASTRARRARRAALGLSRPEHCRGRPRSGRCS